MRMLVLSVAEHRLTVCEMDIMETYLQAKEFKRVNFVRSPREENDGAGLEKLLVPPHKLIDSGCLL